MSQSFSSSHSPNKPKPIQVISYLFSPLDTDLKNPFAIINFTSSSLLSNASLSTPQDDKNASSFSPQVRVILDTPSNPSLNIFMPKEKE